MTFRTHTHRKTQHSQQLVPRLWRWNGEAGVRFRLVQTRRCRHIMWPWDAPSRARHIDTTLNI